MLRTTAALVISGLLTGCASLPYAPLVTPWHVPEATHRQLVEVRSRVVRTNAVAGPELDLPDGGVVKLVDVAQPDTALPVLRDGNHLSVRLPGELLGVRRLAVYWAKDGLPAPSRLLDSEPLSEDDYATTAHGDAWDFDEGDQDGIRSWGDRPHHYGTITVRDGRLTVPVTGNDPYCIWGVMFGNPVDQPPGHTGSPAERIDSALYSRLRMRLRQSCPMATWTLFFTDEKGRYQSHDVDVRGSDFQTLEFNLPELFPGFWDGRAMRAFRLDTTNDRPGTTVDIDWVRIERETPNLITGPVLPRHAIAQRDATTGFRVSAPRTAPAGTDVELTVLKVRGNGATHLRPEPQFACELRTSTGDVIDAAADSAGGPKNKQGRLRLRVGTSAREVLWTVGLADDLGRPTPPLKTGKITVVPATIHHYTLMPETRFVSVEGSRRVRIAVTGSDAFGNVLPVRATQPNVLTDNTGTVALQHGSRGNCSIILSCSDTPLTTHTVVFSDEHGISGTCEVRTIRFRKSAIAITPNGYITIAGSLVLPLGGFYANWPSGLPDANGVITRSIDLFPCNATPYPHGYPWPADVELKLNDYLDLCRTNGVTTLRLMLRNMDIVGRVDPVQLQATLRLFDLARERDIRFDVALFEDYAKPPYCNADIIEKIALPHYTPEELAALPEHRARFLARKDVLAKPAERYRDPDAIRCQREYLDELIPVLASREEILCYEFENEMVRPPMSWCRDIAAHIRTIDPHTPILGNPGQHAWPEPWRWRDSSCDLFSYHPYNDGMPGADHGAVIYARSKWAATSGIPFFTGEGGINQNRWQKDIRKVSGECAMRGIRDQIWLSMMCGANGALMWTAGFGSEMAEFGKVSAALDSLGINVLDLERRRPHVVVTMPDDSSANAAACRLAYQLLSRGIDFDVRPEGNAAGYRVTISGADVALPMELAPEFFAPTQGWQAATLIAQTGDQAVVYLRNVAGGITNYGGEKRACWLRTPQARSPSIRIVGGTWSRIKAFDLDDGCVLELERHGDLISVPQATSHDLIFGFRKQ